MERIQCRNCECRQPKGPSCRRCHRPLPGGVEPQPQPAADIAPQPVQDSVAGSVMILAADPRQTLEQIERAIILARIEHCRGNVVRAAETLGVSKSTLYRKLHEYEISQNGTESSEPSCNQNATVQL
jgi:DNA-binding NtrC family response regulator